MFLWNELECSKKIKVDERVCPMCGVMTVLKYWHRRCAAGVLGYPGPQAISLFNISNNVRELA